MKLLTFTLLAVTTMLFASACSTGAHIGTRHHHIDVGGSIGR